ncbi:SusC/RagA family TonB-linked outer membrane protein [Labilibaculum euxinus]
MKKNREKSFMQKRKPFLAKRLLLLFLVVNVFSFQTLANLQGEILELEMTGGSLIEVFAKVKEKTNYTFLYNVDDIKEVNNVTISASPKSVQTILTDCLKDTGLTYEIRDEVIIIKPAAKPVTPAKEEKPVVEEKKVGGVVTDNTGVGLPGVSVFIKGTSIGTTTNIDGKYNIQLPDASEAILVFSFIGMDTQEITVTNQKVIDVVLVAGSEQIDEVVVTGYQKIDRKLFIGAATKVKMEEVKLVSESDISKSLEGQVAGVSVQNVSSTFGTAPKIRVRGASSIYGNQKPLWVIDGIVLEDAVEVSMDDLNSGDLSTIISSGVAGLNMDDIESFQILKDVSATALYGARAMNGVIVITTKKGRKGKLDINYSMGLTLKPRPSYDDYNIMNSKDQMSVNRELYEKGWTNIAKTQFASKHGAYGKMFDLISKNDIDWATNNDEINTFLRKYETANTNWFDELFQTGVQQQHTVSISGGGEKATFYTSVGYLDDSGWTIADNVKRYTTLLKGTYHVTDKFTVVASSNMSFRDQNLSGVTNSKDDDGMKVDRFTGRIQRDFDNNPFMYAMTTSRNIRAYDDDGNLEYFRRNYADYNVIDELSKNKTGVKVQDMSFSTDFNYELRKNLIFSSRLSARYYHAETMRKIHEDSNEANAYRAGMRPEDSEVLRDANPLLYERPGTTTGIKYSILPEGGIYEVRNNNMENYYFNGSVNWNPTIGEDHLFTFLGGAEVRDIKRDYNWNKGYGHFFDMGNVSKPSPNYIEYLAMGNGTEPEDNTYFGKQESCDRFVAYYLNYGYSYKGKYTLNGTVRYDGSNRLGKSNTARWTPTWNIGGKWRVKEENFLSSTNWLNQLDLKSSYGLNGSLGSATNATLLAYSAATKRPFQPNASELQIYIKNLGNNDLSWEKQYEFNIGTEFSMFNNRISGEFNYYNRKGFDLIGQYIGNGVGGERKKWGNVADKDAYGYEVSLNFIPVKFKDFKWNFNVNYSYNKSKITDLLSTSWMGEASSVFGVPVLGDAVRGIYSSRFAGLDNKGIPTFYDRNDEKVHYLNVQTDDYSDFVYSGSLEPTTNLGISNRFTYKGVSLSVLVTGQFGHKKRVMQEFSYKYTDAQALTSHLKNRWRVSGDENKTNIPAILDADFLNKSEASDIKTAYQLFGMSDYWIADASFLRVKNISLSYKLPNGLVNKFGLERANISMQATNVGLLWLADKKKLNGEDPEFVWSGGTTMPISKQFTFTLNVGF